MLHRTSYLAIALTLVLSARAQAGGPPRLNLPLTGVDQANAAACKELLASNLKNVEWEGNQAQWNGYNVFQRGDQWYLGFYMKDDVSLSEIEAALKGSSFAIDREHMRLFGHVTLAIKTDAANDKAIEKALAALPQASIVEMKRNEGELLATIAMPYPPVEDSNRWGGPEWKLFRTGEYEGVTAAKSDPVDAKALPTIDAVSEAIEAHSAKLSDVRWTSYYACRPIGGVSVFEAKDAAKATKITKN